MSGIEELQQRVVEAEKRFGLINEQRSKYSERLVGLIDAVEVRLRDQQAEIERQTVELAAQGEELESRRHEAAENQTLRGMLHSLLQAIEAGSGDVLTETMQTMDAKVSALIAENVALVPALDQALPEAVDDGANSTPALEAPEAEDPQTMAPEMPAAVTAQPDAEEPIEVPDDALDAEAEEAPEAPETLEHAVNGAGELTEAQVADLLGESDTAETPEHAQEQGALETPQVADLLGESDTAETPEHAHEQGAIDTPQADDEPAADQGPDLDAEAGDAAEPEPWEVLPESGDSIEAGEEMAAAPAFDQFPSEANAPAAELTDETEPAATPEAAEYPQDAPPIDDLVQEEAADPDYSAIGDDSNDKAGTTSLEDIMRRVSKLVEEEGALSPLPAGSVRIGAEVQDGTPSDPEAEDQDPAPSKMAASNG